MSGALTVTLAGPVPRDHECVSFAQVDLDQVAEAGLRNL